MLKEENLSIAGVIFDLDGVITHTSEFHYQAWKMIAVELGIHFDRRINDNLKGINREESLNILLQNGNSTYSNDEKHFLAERKNNYYQQLIKKITRDDLFPGVINLLEELIDSNIKIALASASKNANTIIEQLQIKHLFNHVVDVSLIKNGKPNPEIFLAAATALEVPPSKCIGIEDSSAGIVSIKEAGMIAVGVGDSKELKKADLLVDHIKDLTIKELKQLFNAQVEVH